MFGKKNDGEFVWSVFVDQVNTARKPKPSGPRTLDDSDVSSWFESADRRPLPPQSREEVIALIKKRNSYRWWRLNYDYKWLRKEMKKLGYNPDEARELL